jgi:hypothetical protein
MDKPQAGIIPAEGRKAKAAADAADGRVGAGDVALGRLVALDVDPPGRLGHLEPRLLFEPEHPVWGQALLGQKDHEDLALCSRTTNVHGQVGKTREPHTHAPRGLSINVHLYGTSDASRCWVVNAFKIPFRSNPVVSGKSTGY